MNIFLNLKGYNIKAVHKRAKTGWLGFRVMCQSGATCCFSELAL